MYIHHATYLVGGKETADSVKISSLTEVFSDTLIPPPLPHVLAEAFLRQPRS